MVDSVVRELPDPGSTDRTRLRRIPDKAVTERAIAYEILDAGLVAHVSVIQEGQPFVLPVGYARAEAEVLIHGSSGSRLFRTLAEGAPTCLTVTLLDGMVLARSAFESSMHYRSVMALGRARRLEGSEELEALNKLTEHLLPGRSRDARPPSKKELAATLTLALPLDEISVKVSAGFPDDDPADLTDPIYSKIWAGIVPMSTKFGTPIPDQFTPEDCPVPDYIASWKCE
jgi:nitroimidazol reductase NimA-like FMN-containing flavoprotein (pyridoxamine 5'-phosphate oxidase superfamily)